MKVLKLIGVIILLSSCSQKTTQELLLGNWQVSSRKLKNMSKGYIDTEKLQKEWNIVFEKDSLHLMEEGHLLETFHYFLIGDSHIVTEDHIGFYQIKLINKKHLHLYEEIDVTYVNGNTIEEKHHAEYKIKLNRK